jgi:hypothetical protein
MTTNNVQRAILQQKYVVACELRTLAALQHGRDSDQFKNADAKCVKAASNLANKTDFLTRAPDSSGRSI